jgi:hypothetical protein
LDVHMIHPEGSPNRKREGAVLLLFFCVTISDTEYSIGVSD